MVGEVVRQVQVVGSLHARGCLVVVSVLAGAAAVAFVVVLLVLMLYSPSQPVVRQQQLTMALASVDKEIASLRRALDRLEKLEEKVKFACEYASNLDARMDKNHAWAVQAYNGLRSDHERHVKQVNAFTDVANNRIGGVYDKFRWAEKSIEEIRNSLGRNHWKSEDAIVLVEGILDAANKICKARRLTSHHRERVTEATPEKPNA